MEPRRLLRRHTRNDQPPGWPHSIVSESVAAVQGRTTQPSLSGNTLGLPFVWGRGDGCGGVGSRCRQAPVSADRERRYVQEIVSLTRSSAWTLGSAVDPPSASCGDAIRNGARSVPPESCNQLASAVHDGEAREPPSRSGAGTPQAEAGKLPTSTTPRRRTPRSWGLGRSRIITSDVCRRWSD